MYDLIFLVGYRGCGKTSAGRILAESLRYDFVDTDHLITAQKKASVKEIVAEHGWQKFRRCEKQTLNAVKYLRKTVVATGGGAILHRSEWQSLPKWAAVMWLDADERIIRQRIGNDGVSVDQRPSLTGEKTTDELKNVLRERLPLYQQTAHFRIDTNGVSVVDVAQRMKQLISENIG